jgi:two-component system, OmpR family, response regulator TctD
VRHHGSVKLFLVEDDPNLSLALARALEARGHACASCDDGLDALRRLQYEQFDVIVLDVNLPGTDGLTVLSRLRGRGDATPVLVLTARGAVGDRVSGLNAGADDYLAKPFDLDELEARVRALARRNNPEGAVRVGQLRWIGPGHAIQCDAGALELGAREHALLGALLAARGAAVTRDRLFRLVFPHDSAVQAEALETLVHRVRKKIASTDAELVTLRGFGYLLRARPAARGAAET